MKLTKINMVVVKRPAELRPKDLGLIRNAPAESAPCLCRNLEPRRISLDPTHLAAYSPTFRHTWVPTDYNYECPSVWMPTKFNTLRRKRECPIYTGCGPNGPFSPLANIGD